MNQILMIVAKRPAPGQTKTRLSPPLLPEQAAQLYECFLRDTIAMVRCVSDVARAIAYLPDNAVEYFRRLAPDFGLLPQRGTSLGERLDHALTQYLSDGYDRAVVMDSDSPDLPAAYVARAFTLLEHADVVLGPCDDGGYYLIGLKQPQPRLLQVQMSTPHVLQDTLELAKQEKLRVELLPTWYDIDTVEDLKRLKQAAQDSSLDEMRHTREFLKQCKLP